MGFAEFFVCLFQLAEVADLMLQLFSQVHLNELMNNMGWGILVWCPPEWCRCNLPDPGPAPCCGGDVCWLGQTVGSWLAAALACC